MWSEYVVGMAYSAPMALTGVLLISNAMRPRALLSPDSSA